MRGHFALDMTPEEGMRVRERHTRSTRPDEPVPAIWTAGPVFRRLVEAYDTLRRQPGGLLRPGEDGAATYAPPIRSFSDALGAEPTRDPTKWHESFYRLAPAAAAAVDRMEECWGWPLRYLSDQPGASRVMLEMARAEALGMPYTKLIRLKRWAARTAHRKRAIGISLIASGLNADRVPVRLADPRD